MHQITETLETITLNHTCPICEDENNEDYFSIYDETGDIFETFTCDKSAWNAWDKITTLTGNQTELTFYDSFSGNIIAWATV